MNSIGEWLLEFPSYELTRNVALGMILTVILLLQLVVIGESVHAEEMAELSQVLVYMSYLMLFLMVLPLIKWLLSGVSYYTSQRLDWGEPA